MPWREVYMDPVQYFFKVQTCSALAGIQECAGGKLHSCSLLGFCSPDMSSVSIIAWNVNINRQTEGALGWGLLSDAPKHRDCFACACLTFMQHKITW